MARQARDEMAVETVEVVADRGYYDGEEISPGEVPCSCINASMREIH